MFGYHNHNKYNQNHNNNQYHQYARTNITKSNQQQQLMSFHNYVKTVLTNNVDETTACAKYKEFLAGLTQSKVCRFFDANRDLEWFRLKYHPIESQKSTEKQASNLLQRLKLFNLLNGRNFFDKITLDARNSQTILNLMDAAIVYLESGPNDLFERLISLEGADIKPNERSEYIPTIPNSVVIHDLNIETTISEIQELCLQANQNLLRLTPLNPYYVKGGQLKRKFVAIYRTGVDIKDVCWALSRCKLNNQALRVTIDKCLTDRVIEVDPINNHPVCILSDIRKAIVLIILFDEYRGIHGKRKQLLDNVDSDLAMEPNNVSVKMEVDGPRQNSSSVPSDDVAPLSPPGSVKSNNDEDEDKNFDISSLDEEREKEKKKLFEYKFCTDLSNYRLASKLFKSKNPVLTGANDYLIDFIESSQAKYHMSKVPQMLMSTESVDLNLDSLIEDKYFLMKTVLKYHESSIEENRLFLDKMIWYLRIVHSFDYYKKALYKQEDELNFRLSILHVRGHHQEDVDYDPQVIREHLRTVDKEYQAFEATQTQLYITKDEERFNYKSYGKVITDELTSYAQKIQKAPRPDEFEEVYKCKHCTRVFQKLNDIGRHFVSKHRWAIDAIELETDFFNAYLFDHFKINPSAPKELLETRPNRFMNTAFFSQMGEDPDLLKQTIEEYKKMESFVWEPAPRAQVESDPRNESVVDYTDISFDDAI